MRHNSFYLYTNPCIKLQVFHRVIHKLCVTPVFTALYACEILLRCV